MVGESSRIVKIASIATLALLLSLLTAAGAGAQVLEGEASFTLQEEYRIQLNEVGDAHLTDTIVYDRDWFDAYGYIFEENPNLLTRRYRSDVNLGEVEGFDVDVDSAVSTITVSFDTPGLAYNFEDEWAVFGYRDYRLSSLDDEEVTLEASWILSGEFTLFEEIPMDETLIVELPDGAKNTRFDEEAGTIYYELPYAGEGAGGGLLERNRTTFSVIFGVVMALSLLLFIIVVTRRPSVPLQPAASTAAPLAATAVPGFCKRCGQPAIKPGDRFCQNCGAPLE